LESLALGNTINLKATSSKNKDEKFKITTSESMGSEKVNMIEEAK
jgi:hypothetical protein